VGGVKEISEKEEVNKNTTEERIKGLEAKAIKVEMLLSMNICISFIVGGTFFFLIPFLGFYSIIFSIFFLVYAILNWLILIKNNKK
jgi:uncharacterized YccA/Bax inhibitor family protein